MIDILSWAKKFIATPSVSADGNLAIARLAAELIEEIGGRARLLEAHHQGVEHTTIVADFGPEPSEADPGVLLITHLDTVPPGPTELWTQTDENPFQPTEQGDKLYGLGSADAKVDFVCKCAALESVIQQRLVRPIRIIGSFAEEIGMVGARWLVENGLTRGFNHTLISEPSELTAIRAHKGYGVYEARIPLRVAGHASVTTRHDLQGESAHSSTPHLGVNAIEAALERLGEDSHAGFTDICGGDAVNQVPARCSIDLARETQSGFGTEIFTAEPLLSFYLAWRNLLEELSEAKDPAFDPAHTVGNLGKIRLDGSQILISFDLRPIPGVRLEDAIEPLTETAEIVCLRTNPALHTSENSTLLAAVQQAQARISIGERVGTKATCTEAGVISEAGLECLVLGPGLSVGNVHKPNEHTRIPELELARQLYGEILTDLCVQKR